MAGLAAGITWKGGVTPAVVARALREAPDELQTRVRDALRESAAQVQKEASSEALRTLPSRGGLARIVARITVDATTKLGGKKQSIELTGYVKGTDLRAIESGRIRHPVFGNRRRWVSQKIRAGFWERSIEAQRKPTTDRMNDAVRQTLASIARKST